MFWTKVPFVTTDELQMKLKERPTVLDVREPYEFKARHIKGAKNVPLRTIKTYEGKGPVYVVCQSGARSSSATKKLIKMGVEAINVRGGMNNWTGPTK